MLNILLSAFLLLPLNWLEVPPVVEQNVIRVLLLAMVMSKLAHILIILMAELPMPERFNRIMAVSKLKNLATLSSDADFDTVGTRVSSGNSQSMGYLPRRQYAPRHTIEGYAYLPTSAGYQDLGTGIQPVDRPVLHHARPSGRTPYSHASGLGVRRPIPATVGLDINVGFPATPGYAGPVGDITVGDLAIDPNLEGATGYAEINTNGEEYPGALFDKLLEENDAGVYDNMLENDAGAVAVAVDAGAGVYDNMLGNDAGAVDAGAGADTGGAPHSNVQDDMPAPRSRGRPRGSKRKAPSDEQKNNKPATRVRITPPAPPVTLPDGKPSLTASLGDPAVPSTHQRKLPSLVDAADPFCCHLCYHCFIQKSTLRDHYYDTHKEQLGLTRKSLNDYHYAKRENMKTLSWYNAQGLDTTYRGTDRKQINARRRMVAGLKTTDPNYLRDVYKDTTAEKYKLKKT